MSYRTDPVVRAASIDQAQVEVLRGKVLVHLGSNSMAADHLDDCDGLIFRGSAGFNEAKANPSGLLRLVDPELYAGDRGRSEQLQLVPETLGEAIQAQLSAGVGALLAPSRFPRQRDETGIQRVLEDGATFVAEASKSAPHLPAFVPLVVRFDELVDGRWIRPVAESGLPIATIFAGFGDPLAAAAQLEGAISILGAAASSVVIRCDTSVAGLMTLGASAGAIGASSSVRHLWLPSRRRGGSPSPSLFVPRFGSWMKVSFVEQALADPDLDHLFGCECAVCGPGGDVRSLTLPGVRSELQNRHSAASAVRLAKRVLDSDYPVAEWRVNCEAAKAAYDELARLGISGPTPPGALEAWLTVLG